MHVQCIVEKENLLSEPKGLQKCIVNFLISPEHPASRQFFRSDIAIRKEQQRQVNLGYYVIHPFSKFRAWYELWLLILLSSLIVTKSLEGSLIRRRHYKTMPFYIYYSLFTDAMNVVDILVTCFTGYLIKELNMVELNRLKIVKKYILSIYFIVDVLTSLPRPLIYFEDYYPVNICNGVMCIICLLKILRLPTLIKYFYKAAYYFEFSSRGTTFLLSCIIVSMLVVHYMACLQFAIPRIGQRHFVKDKVYVSWIYKNNLYDSHSLIKRYIICFFRSSSYILGIRLVIFRTEVAEEYILAVVTYIIGKILLTFTWIILAVSILNSRSMEIKFFEIINQLDEYMNQKCLPLNLRRRILQYYNFKYQKNFFKEELISKMLSATLKTDVDKYLCKSLIKNVSLFTDLSPLEVDVLIKFLVPELFLPNDIIIKSGTTGDTMYFLSSGTVAVYTHSGKEICHLQDGDYFGEICLVLKDQSRSATIIAIEISQVYRLNKKAFLNSLFKNKKVLEILLNQAEKRLKETVDTEEIYKKTLLEQTLLMSEDLK